MKYKICNRCNTKKTIDEFSKNRAQKDGLQSWCKYCMKKCQEYWYQDNKEIVCKRMEQYYQEYKKEYSEYGKQYYQDHKEEVCKRMKQYRQDNKEKCNLLNQRRRAKIRNLPHDLSDTEWAFTITLFEDKCAYCEEPIEGTVHYEHVIIPDNGGGFTLGNIVPACRDCNCGVDGKFQKDVYIWMKERSFDIQKFKDRMQIIKLMRDKFEN